MISSTTLFSGTNFRDLGGITTADGREIRPGLLYRSHGPAGFPAAHKEELDQLGIRLVCDLRSEAERAAHPYELPGEVRNMHFALRADLRTEQAVGWRMLEADPTAAGARAAMCANYASMPAILHNSISVLFAELAAGNVPALLHCTAGKDRTGVLMAILLLALGVDSEQVFADYMRSEVFARISKADPDLMAASQKMLGFAPSEETVHALIEVRPEYLNAALSAIKDGWGGIEGYLASARIESELRTAMQHVLLGGR